MRKIRFIVVFAALVALAFAAFVVFRSRPETAAEEPAGGAVAAEKGADAAGGVARRANRARPIAGAEAAGKTAAAEAADDDGDDVPEPMTEEEKREAEEEKLVEAFDSLVDDFCEPREKGVSVADTKKFLADFAKVPKDRKEECLQRALNLVPDENVMLLAGVLMNPDEDKELVELVFNDILNRDEDVKKVLLERVYRTRGHPCRAEAAWILDATGQLPGAGKE